MKNTLTANDMIKSLSNADGQLPVYITCSFNRFEVKRIIVLKDSILIDVGEANNPIES